MARYPLMHTSSRLGRRWMKGGTIFGKSTRMHNNPLRLPTAHREKEAFDYMMKHYRQMRGGTIFGKGDLRKVLWANQAKARRQKGGNLFSKLKKRI